MRGLLELSNIVGINSNKLKKTIIPFYEGLYSLYNGDISEIKEELIDMIINDKKYIEQSFIMKHVSKILGISHTTVKTMLGKEFPLYRIIWGNTYIPKKIVYEYIESRNNYFTTRESSKICEVTEGTIIRLINKGIFKDVRKLKNAWLINKMEVYKYKNDLNFIKNSYSLNQLINILGKCRRTILINYIDKVFRDYKMIFNKIYVSTEEVDTYLEKLKKTQMRFNNYYKIQDAAKKLNTTEITLSKAIKEQNITDVQLVNDIQLISKEFVDNYSKRFADSYTVKEFSQIIGCSGTTIIKYIRNNMIQDSFLHFNKTLRIPKDNIKIVTDKLDTYRKEKEQLLNFSEYELVKHLLSKLDNRYKKTKETFLMYLYNKIGNSTSNNIKKRILAIAKTLLKFYYIFPNEVFNLTNFEIENIMLTEGLTKSDRSYITDFLRYSLILYKNECHFDKQFKIYPKSKKKYDSNNIYSKEVWIKYYNFLTNIDSHLYNAISNKTYSSIWLYGILHLSLTWRKSDLLQMPNLDLSLLSINDFDWFKNKDNIFTLGMAELVIKYLEEIINDTLANKNKAKLHFVVSTDTLLATAISYVICEIHRRNNNNDKLFSSKYTIDIRNIRKFFTDKELSNFSNIKANRTLLTYSFNEAVGKEGRAELAYSMSSYMRSHKYNNNLITPSTAQYIYSTNKDGILGDITYNLFKRGHFGELYKLLVEITYGEFDNISETTQQIINMRQAISPIQIEGISELIRYKNGELNSVLEELILTDKNKLKNKLEKLSKGKMVSKTNFVQCFHSGNCPFPYIEKCFGCKYSLPLRYSLYLLKDEINNNIKILKSIREDNYFYTRKHSVILSNLLMVVNEAKKEYDKYDDKFIENLFSLERINDDIKTMYGKTFLLYKEVK